MFTRSTCARDIHIPALTHQTDDNRILNDTLCTLLPVPCKPDYFVTAQTSVYFPDSELTSQTLVQRELETGGSALGRDDCTGVFGQENAQGSEPRASSERVRDHGWSYDDLLRQDRCSLGFRG